MEADDLLARVDIDYVQSAILENEQPAHLGDQAPIGTRVAIEHDLPDKASGASIPEQELVLVDRGDDQFPLMIQEDPIDMIDRIGSQPDDLRRNSVFGQCGI